MIKSIHAYIFLIFILSIFLGLLITPDLILNSLWILKSYSNKSSASVSVFDNKLKIKFDLDTKEKRDAEDFASNLAIPTDWLEEIILDLDQDSLNKISSNLPAKVRIDFEKSMVSFSSPNLPRLANPLSVSSYTFATSSGKLAFDAIDENNYYFTIYNPKPLLEYATSSSKITLSPKLNDLFPILSKISKIEMRVFGKNISGEIELK